MNRDDIRALADEYYGGDAFESDQERAFALLVDVAAHTYETYLEGDRPDPDDPESFTPSTLMGVNHGWALIQGLVENLEIRFPDADFRRMGVGGM